MKKLFLFFSILIFFSSCKERSKITIEGNLKNVPKKIIYFDKIDLYQTILIDSTKINKKGNFRIKYKTKDLAFYQLRTIDNQKIMLFLEPGQKAIVYGDFKDLKNTWKINESQSSRLVQLINMKLIETREKLDSLTNEYKRTTDDIRRKVILDEYEKIIENHRKFTIEIIVNFYNDPASIIALYQQLSDGVYVLNRLRDIQLFKLVSDSLGKRYPRFNFVKMLKRNTEQMLNQYYQARLLTSDKVKVATLPEINLPDMNNKNFSLSSLKGKYILLNFWATWMDNAEDYNLELKEIYERYKNKNFEIYSVAFENNPESWKKFIKYNELNWINVIDTAYPYSTIPAIYNIQALPTNFLIDKNFETILYKNLTPRELNNIIKDLIKK